MYDGLCKAKQICGPSGIWKNKRVNLELDAKWLQIVIARGRFLLVEIGNVVPIVVNENELMKMI